MSKAGKLVLGVITVTAPLLLAVVGVVHYRCVRRAIDTHSHPPYILWLGLLMLLGILTCFGLLVFYTVHSRRTTSIPAEKRDYWLGILWAFNIFAYPVYWYRVVWKDGSD